MMSTKQTKNTPKKDSSQSKITISGQSYTGPIPPSLEFSQYERTLPGSANRILNMAESLQDHKIKVSEREQILHYVSKFSAHLIVLIIALTALSAGTYLILEGHGGTGIGMILGALATFAGTVIYGKSQSDESK